ncbi:MAG TPA: hypothetical protein VM925_22625 [Labilithrix sp.]|nr:hypothetical protein [Labilithrix sp.]
MERRHVDNQRAWAALRIGGACLFGLFAILFWEPSARADVSVVAPNGKGCPTEAAVRERVRARLSTDLRPRLDDARVDIRIAEAGEEGVLVGSLSMESAVDAGQARAFQSRSCVDLADTLALAVALFIEQNAPVSSASKADEKPEKPEKEPPKPSKVEWTIGPALGTSVGDTPEVALTGTVFGDLRIEAFRASVEAHATTPGEVASSRGRAQSRSVGGLGAACLGISWFFGCAVGSVDAVIVHGVDVPASKTSRSVGLGAGARGGIAIPLGPRFALRATVDALYSLVLQQISIADRAVYEYAPVIVRAALGFGVRF